MAEEASLLKDNESIIERRFQEQCYLIDNVRELSDANVEEKDKSFNGPALPPGLRKPYKNFTQIISEPGPLINKLLGRGIKEFIDIKPHQLSLLYPKIRIFKVITTKDGKEKDFELKFDDHTTQRDVENLLKNRHQRGMGVGLKSFEWRDLGTNPGDAGIVLEATLHIHFQSVETLFASQGEASFSDLIKTIVNPREENVSQHVNNKPYRIKAQVGWAIPNSTTDIISPQLKKSIENSVVNLDLSLTTHELDFKENGTIDLKAKYIASPEATMLMPEADILYTDREVKPNGRTLVRTSNDEHRDAEITTRERNIKRFENQITTESFGSGAKFSKSDLDNLKQLKEINQKKLEVLIEERENVANENKIQSYKRFLERLENTNRIFFVDLSKEEIRMLGIVNDEQTSRGDTLRKRDEIKKFRQERKPLKIGTTKSTNVYNADNNAKIMRGALSSERGGAKLPTETTEAANKNGDGTYRINFTFLGDIINTALDVLNRGVSDINFILGTTEYVDPLTKKTVSLPLADIPVSINHFNTWFFNKAIRPQLTKYLLYDFLKDLVSEMLVKVMHPDCFGDNSRFPKNLLNFSVFSLSGNELKTNTRVDVDEIKNMTPFRDPRKETKQYFMIHCSNIPSVKRRGEYKDDFRDGIYHFFIGADRGLLKRVSFDRVDITGWKEARIYNATELRKDNIFLSEPYNATVYMYGNSIFKTGMQVYIDPISMGINTFDRRNLLPIGGYFNIINVENVIEPGKFETILKLTWVASPDFDKPKQERTRK